MSSFILSDYDNFQLTNPKINFIYEIVESIKNNNFNDAYIKLIDKKISLYELVSITQRLKIEKFIKFADFVIQQRINNG